MILFVILGVIFLISIFIIVFCVWMYLKNTDKRNISKEEHASLQHSLVAQTAAGMHGNPWITTGNTVMQPTLPFRN